MSQGYCVAGWDVGGSHLKLALLDAQGMLLQVRQMAMPMWLGLESLEHALDQACRELPQQVEHVCTMTAELCDCFPDRAQGVRSLVQYLQKRFTPAPLHFYSIDGLLDCTQALRRTDVVASANWHALLSLCAARLPAGILLDIGGTSADLLPFADGHGQNLGKSDVQRMQHEELIYTGVIRTPVMALCREIPFRGQWTHLAAEHFATTADVYRLTGDLGPEQDLQPSADGAGKSRADCARRLARMVGTDAEPQASLDEWEGLARYLAERHLDRLQRALYRLCSRPLRRNAPLIGAGLGRFLVPRLAERMGLPWLDFTDLEPVPASLRESAAVCASALAPARLFLLRRDRP